MAATQLFKTVTKTDYLGFARGSDFDFEKVAKFINFSERDLARITNVGEQSIRLDSDHIPTDVRKRLLEIVSVANLVAEFFSGDPAKTELWFHTENPMLGGVAPRDMLRLGRYSKLISYILQARDESGWGKQHQESTTPA